MKSKRNRKSIIGGALLVFFILLMLVLFVWQKYGKPAYGKGTTLKEAYEIALEEATKWSGDADVIQIISTDFCDTESSENGIDGKRKCWSFLFESKEKDRQYSMYIINGKPDSVMEVQSPGYQPIDMENITMDSPQMYRIAQEQGMKGGKDWAFGYHYILQYVYFSAADETPVLTFTVRGLDEQDRETQIIVDPYDGDILVTLTKTGYDDTGRSIWERTGGGENTEAENMEPEETVPDDRTREEIQEEYGVYKKAREFLVDPEELTDAIIDGIGSERFDPYASLKVYTREEWESRMTELYGEEWREW